MIKYIDVNSPLYRNAPKPKFNPKKVNESVFEDELRPKEFDIRLDIDNNVCDVEWLSQEADYFSNDLGNEIIRAIKANGANPGTTVNVRYGQRDYGLHHVRTLNVA